MDREPELHSAPVLRPGHNCWRVEAAERVAFVIDAELYFRAAKAAIQRARHSILLLAWDYHPRVRLEPGVENSDGADTMRDLFQQLVKMRPELEIRVLKWNLALLFTPMRNMMPLFVRDRLNSGRLHVRLDGGHPTGGCQHQKVLVVDDAIAFCGGIDFAGNRWDTRDHPDHEPRRRRPNGKRYPPHHDMMMAVDGDAAAALGDLARERWRHATGERLEPPPRGDDLWPDELLRPDVRAVGVAIARTTPAYRGRPEIREVQTLYLDAIAQARETLYFESQYFACPRIAGALADRLAEPDGPEVVVINPKRSPSWLEQDTMDAARDLAVARLRKADRHDRFRIFAALTPSGQEIVVHSKTMVADDRLVRIGSANLSRRSMGFDSECDLALEAPAGAAREAEVRRAIRDFRDGLVAEHLRVPLERVRTALANAGSLVRALDGLRQGQGGGLADLPPTEISGAEELANQSPIDPDQPEPRASLAKLLGRRLLWLGTPSY